MKTPDNETKRCLLCVRTPFSDILDLTSVFYSEPFNYEIAEMATILIRDNYLKYPPELCGKHPKRLIGGAVYVASVLNGCRITQKKIAAAIGSNIVTIRHGANHFIRLGVVIRL